MGTHYQPHPVAAVPLSPCCPYPARSVGYNCLEIDKWHLPKFLFSYSCEWALAVVMQAQLILVNLNVSSEIAMKSTFGLRAG
jgi:hypothetical protein